MGKRHCTKRDTYTDERGVTYTAPTALGYCRMQASMNWKYAALVAQRDAAQEHVRQLEEELAAYARRKPVAWIHGDDKRYLSFTKADQTDGVKITPLYDK